MKIKLEFRLIYYNSYKLLLFLFIKIILQANHLEAIQLKQIRIPEKILLGSSVTLICDFKLENKETLYSVKWYKNNMEFYRYINSSTTYKYTNNFNKIDYKDFKIFFQTGIYLDEKKSNTTHILLKKSDLNTEGIYGCEVSTNTFSTVIAEKDLKIYVQPKIPLKMEIIENDKSIELYCKTYESKPASLIYFLFNGQIIKQSLYKYIQLGELKTNRTNDSLISSSLNLKIPKTSLSVISQIVNNILYRQNKKENIIKSKLNMKNLASYNKYISDQKIHEINNRFKRDELYKKNIYYNNYKTIENLKNQNYNNQNQSLNLEKTNLIKTINQVKSLINFFKNQIKSKKLINISYQSQNINNIDKIVNENYIENNWPINIKKVLELKNLTELKNYPNYLNELTNFLTNSLLVYENLLKENNLKQENINRSVLPKPLSLTSETDLNSYKEQDNLIQDGLELSCVSTITQPIATTYAELNLEENSFSDNSNNDKTNNDFNYNKSEYQPIFIQDEFSAPRIVMNKNYLISENQILNANCSVNKIYSTYSSLYRIQPILKWFINDREANIDELILYDNLEILDKNVRNFASNYQAYGLIYGNELKYLKNQTLLKSQYSSLNEQYKYSKDYRSNHVNKKRKKLGLITLGLNFMLTKEHFQTIDGSIKLRCTCTYSTLLKHEIKSVQLQNSSKKSLFWFSSNAKRPFGNKINLFKTCASIFILNFIISRLFSIK